MSAKDSFFKKVQENTEAQKSHEERAKDEIKQFQSKTLSLVQQIQSWLDGSGIAVVQGTTNLHDDTVDYLLGNGSSLSRYSIANILMKNGSKTARITPEYLYGIGSKGCLSLTVDNPSRASRQQKFSLFMQGHNRNDEGWILTRKDQPSTNGVILTEETFFEAISGLA